MQCTEAGDAVESCRKSFKCGFDLLKRSSSHEVQKRGIRLAGLQIQSRSRGALMQFIELQDTGWGREALT